MKQIALTLCAAILVLVGCTRFDDLEHRVNDIDQRVLTLEEKVASLNAQITTLEGLVKTIQDGGYIQSVTTETKDGINYYKLTLSNGKEYTIHDGAAGKDGVAGQDGKTPVIGVLKDEADGNFYWTVDGVFTDPKVRVNGEDGKTPKMSVQQGYLVIEWPGQEPLYYEVKGEPGKNGDSFFQKVDVLADEVVFTLADGTSFTMPLVGNFQLVCPSTTVGVSASSVATLPYELKGVKKDEQVVVYVKYVSAGWTATVDELKKEIKINVPADPNNGLVIVEAINNTTSQVAAQAIRFEAGVLTATKSSYEVADGATTIQVPFETNMNYTVSVDVPWLKQVLAKAAHTETVEFSVEANDATTDRNAVITIKGAVGNELKVSVLQKGCPPLKETYQIGEYYNRKGVEGVVYHCDANVLKILSMDEKTNVKFGDDDYTNSWADNVNDGFANQKAILDNKYSNIKWFPAHNWCYTKGAGWYLPAKAELEEIFNNFSKLNESLKLNKGTELSQGSFYWSSTQNKDTKMATLVCRGWDSPTPEVKESKPSASQYTARAAYNIVLKEAPVTPPAQEAIKIGDKMTLDNGDGVVAYIDETGKSGYVISVKESDRIKFATSMEAYDVWPKDEVDYQANYQTMLDAELPCEARTWAGSCGTAGWRVPAKQQMEQIMKNRSAINKGLLAIGGKEVLAYERYWTSTTVWDAAAKTTKGWVVTYSDGAIETNQIKINSMFDTALVRAIHKFEIK